MIRYHMYCCDGIVCYYATLCRKRKSIQGFEPVTLSRAATNEKKIKHDH